MTCGSHSSSAQTNMARKRWPVYILCVRFPLNICLYKVNTAKFMAEQRQTNDVTSHSQRMRWTRPRVCLFIKFIFDCNWSQFKHRSTSRWEFCFIEIQSVCGHQAAECSCLFSFVFFASRKMSEQFVNRFDTITQAILYKNNIAVFVWQHFSRELTQPQPHPKPYSICVAAEQIGFAVFCFEYGSSWCRFRPHFNSYLLV